MHLCPQGWNIRRITRSFRTSNHWCCSELATGLQLPIETHHQSAHSRCCLPKVLYIPTNHGADETTLFFLGFKVRPANPKAAPTAQVHSSVCIPGISGSLQPCTASGRHVGRLRAFGRQGESTKDRRGIVEAIYETKPMMADHKVRAPQPYCGVGKLSYLPIS